jgi:hypothetical protein
VPQSALAVSLKDLEIKEGLLAEIAIIFFRETKIPGAASTFSAACPGLLRATKTTANDKNDRSQTEART